MAAAVLVCLIYLALSYAHTGERSNSLAFVSLGDWGGQSREPYTTQGQRDAAESMGATAAAVSSSFTVALGDNFYFTGVHDATSPRFQETFEVKFVPSFSCFITNRFNSYLSIYLSVYV